MHFAYPLPWWLALVLAAAIGGVTVAAYRRPLAPLTRWQRAILAVCRALALTTVVLFLFRPIVLVRPRAGNGSIVPVLVDVSRSMRLNDAGGQTRLARAVGLLQTTSGRRSRQFTPEIYTVGAGRAGTPRSADRRWPQSDLAGRSPRFASAIEVSRSRASSCCPTAGIPVRLHGRDGSRGAGVYHWTGIGRSDPRP
jgi:hypothetical protein